MDCVYRLWGDVKDKFQLGNKGANLVEMTQLELPVLPGFVVLIKAYEKWRETGLLPDKAIREALASLESKTNRKLGHDLEVSVRSSAPVSMPGMMDTVLNIGNLGQVNAAIKHIFESWDNMRAVEYRRLNQISSTLGTAAIVQVMVYGNRDEKSGTGVVFTRNSSTGQKGLYGEYMIHAQGEDIVSGVRTPEPIAGLKTAMLEVYAELEKITARLEGHFYDMQDIEFTIESGTLYILQTRAGKRTGSAAVKIAIDMVNEGLITREEAVMRVTVDDIKGLIHKQLKTPEVYQPIVRGLNAAPGAVGGRVVFDVAEALQNLVKSSGTILQKNRRKYD